jgi:N-alpha-acetyl-L-2,4-diaminobutyrate deacetylase
MGLQQDNAYAFTEHNGLLEPCVKLGDPVQTGDLIARVYASERTGNAAVEYTVTSDGIIVGRHLPFQIKIGDF